MQSNSFQRRASSFWPWMSQPWIRVESDSAMPLAVFFHDPSGPPPARMGPGGPWPLQARGSYGPVLARTSLQGEVASPPAYTKRMMPGNRTASLSSSITLIAQPYYQFEPDR